MPKKGFKHPEDCEHCAKVRATKGIKHPEDCTCGSCSKKGIKHKEDCTCAFCTGEASKKVSREQQLINQRKAADANRGSVRPCPPDCTCGRHFVPEERIEKLKGREWTQEQKDAVSERMKGNDYGKGIVWDVEARQAHSELLKERWANPIYRDTYLEKIVSALNSPESRAKQSATMKKLWQEESFANKYALAWIESSKRLKERWANDPEFRLKCLNNFRKIRNGMLTAHERVLILYIQENFPNADVETNYPVDSYLVDVVLPEMKLGFEADGDWHNNDKDSIRDKRLFEVGWLITRYTNKFLETWAESNGVDIKKLQK